MDTAFVVIVVIILAIVSIVGYVAFDDLNTDLQADAEISANAKAEAQDLYDRYPTWIDGLIVFALVLLWILAIAFSFLLDTHPIFFIITVIALAIVLIAGMVMANMYEEITEDENMGSLATNFPMTNWLMSHFLIVIIAMGGSIALALFGKNKFMGS